MCLFLFLLIFILFYFAVCREWIVREDLALAQQLQSQESRFSFFLLFVFLEKKIYMHLSILPS